MTTTPVPQRRNLHTTRLAYIYMANWRPTRGLSWLFFPPNYLFNCGYNQGHCGAPPLTNLLQLLNLWWWFCCIYTHRFSLTHLLFLLCPISIHLSIRKLSLQAKWLPDVHSCEDFFKGQGHILINSIESMSFEVKLSFL